MRTTMDHNDSPPPGGRGGLSDGQDPPLKADAFFPLPRGGQSSVAVCYFVRSFMASKTLSSSSACSFFPSRFKARDFK
jgi:hypothetical protein